MSGCKVGLCTVSDSSEVTMINEDGVIAEMIIEVDDDDHLETHEPFNFELDEDDDDCIEVYSSGFAPSRNNYIGHNSSQNWMCNKDVQFGVNTAGEGKEVTPGLCDLNLHGESVMTSLVRSDVSKGVEEPCVPVIESVTNSEKAHEYIVIDDASAKMPRRKYGKKLPPPRSSMVTRGKAAANQISVNDFKEATSDKPAKEDTVEGAMETTNAKDIINPVSEDIPRKVMSNEGGNPDPLVDVPKEINGKALTEQVVQDASKERSDAAKETAESIILDQEIKLGSNTIQSEEKVVPISLTTQDSTESATLNLGSKLGNSNNQSEEKVVPVGSSAPDIALSSSKVQEKKHSESKVKEVSCVNHMASEDKSPAELQNISGCGEKLGDIPFKSSSEVQENGSASSVNELSCTNKAVEDMSPAEQQNVPGCGEKLGDIPFIQQVIQNITKRHGLRALYKLIYSFRVPKDIAIVKERVLQFNGFPFDENSVGFERKMKTLKAFPDVARRQICCILGIEISSKADTSHGILKFLLKPECQNNQFLDCQNSQFMGARYQPVVQLERLPEELLTYETVEPKFVHITPTKKESPVKRHKRKVAVENSEVRLTRSAKRKLKCTEEEKAEEVEKNVPPSAGTSEEKSSKLKEVENKSNVCEVPLKSQTDGKVNKKGDEADTHLRDSSDTDTDECIEENMIPILPGSSDDETGSVKGTLGRRLGDFRQIKRNVEKADKESLQTLHTVLYDNYNNYDKPENWKKNILRFSGFSFKCVSSKWRRKEFILSLMPPSKLKCIADMLHLQYYSSKSQKALVLNIMKFLSEPRDGMLKRNTFPRKRWKRVKMLSVARQQDKQVALDEENAALEVEALLQDIRKKRHSYFLEDSAESDQRDRSSFRKSKKKKLGNIPNVQFMIITSNYEDIDNLHQLLFLQSGPRAKIRRNVQNFDGFAFGPGSFSYKIRIKLLNKMGYEVAKRIAFFLGLASLGTKIPQQDLNELIMHFLMCPSDIKCKSIKAYPKNFFNNNPTERPVVDITSITNVMKNTTKVEKKRTKKREPHKEKHKEKHKKKKMVGETTVVESDIVKDGAKKIIKTEKNAPENDSSESLVAENVVDSDVIVNVQCEESKKKNVGSEQKVKTWTQNQKNTEMPLSVPRTLRKRKSKRKLNIPGIVKKKRTVLKKENNQPDQNVESEVDDMRKKQFLFRFDPNNKFDSKKILEYLNKESQKSVIIEVPKTEVTEPLQTPVSSAPLKIMAKPELSGSPKVISILLPPPSQSPQKNFSFSSDLDNKTNSSGSNADCAVSVQNISTSSSTVPSHPEGKLPIPPLPKKQVISLTPQSLQNLQPGGPSANMTQIKVPSSLLESMKGSQIEGVIKLPQNFMTAQNTGQVSSSGTNASDVLSLPEVQKCLQQINSANQKAKQVQMIKIPASNSVAFQPGSLNMSGGKVFVIPVKPGSQQFSSLPASVVTPIQLSNHIMVPSSTESGTPMNIPQLIQVAKSYSRTVGTTSVHVNNVTIAKVKPDFVSPVAFPAVSAAAQCLFPVSVTPNSNLVPLPVVKVQSTSVKEPNPGLERPFVMKTDKVDVEKLKQNQSLKQQKEDNNSDSELDEQPLSHLVGHPSDDMLLQNIKEIVIGADLSSITMRKVLQKVYDKYPQFDLTYRKSFLKDTVKKVICSAPPSRII